MWHGEGETVKDATLSEQSVWVWPNAWWPTFLSHSGSLCTVALPLRVTSIPVRFNRVYSEVTLGTLSAVYPSLFLFLEWTNWTIRLMEQTAHVGIIHAFPGVSRAFDWDVGLWLPRLIDGLFTSPAPPTRHTALLFALERRQRGWGMGRGGSHMYELNKGWMSKPEGEKRREPVCVTEQEEGKMRVKGGDKSCVVDTCCTV